MDGCYFHRYNTCKINLYDVCFDNSVADMNVDLFEQLKIS